MNDGSGHTNIAPGTFVEVRGKPWLVEALVGDDGGLPTLGLSCISDDAQGERLDVLWDAEIARRVLDEDRWANVGVGRPDSAEVLAAHIRAIRWRSATAADRDLLQAPFRAGIRLDAYQLLPLRKALRLPRVNLLIADDVGLGKTIEAGLVAREARARTSSSPSTKTAIEDSFRVKRSIKPIDYRPAIHVFGKDRGYAFAVHMWRKLR